MSEEEIIKRNNDTLAEIYSSWLVKHKFDESIAMLVDFYAKWLDQPFFKWESGYCTYDKSGYLEKTDNRIIDCCFSFDALSNAYTGESIPTYESGCGWYYQCLEDVCRDELEILIFNQWLKEFIEKYPRLVEKYAVETVGMGLDEKMEYLCFEDLVGDSNCELEYHLLHEFVETNHEKLFEQIMMIYAGTKHEAEGAEN